MKQVFKWFQNICKEQNVQSKIPENKTFEMSIYSVGQKYASVSLSPFFSYFTVYFMVEKQSTF